MKRIACAALTVMVLLTGQSYAEQFAHPAKQNPRDTMVMPTSHEQSPFDFNHMGAGSDKSDELGVPYYNERT
ncbi:MULTISPECIES: multiple antibiotic resistance protein MarB [Enterobacteriaceae]|jgi:multiple antibiotic resistance protein MarB|uniref:Multiple antibiotic resistance protein MarB n=2 Tax=Enterobacteriaceae TaxID=543 RepID=A0ABW1PWB1_9ENTR|nr:MULTISPECIES: multiple antibiotic resistance protein MarB [Enterobacteriaceae]AUU91164.1 multiple antibiotic resistance protein MarB [Enterobacteriaceae bacterium ENNIH3]AUV08818.1 multiple antibiotic resistance protein MarB [Enterobacteriaceae bacterium ENNIH2]MBS6739947.1 multiple antibiotic resistance protein MarB [Enterobacteriaceae bacterium]MDU4241280.1 multiple antibiotic resistance protein MarB [Bifidobacterium longum]PTA97065.1 multiple antibiotic resistance protein MarB [Kluyvera 